jgi:uncharacterized protein YcbK (DUF882 family)
MRFLTNDVMSVRLFERLKLLETYLQTEIVITSALRLAPDNTAVGGLPKSLHLLGRAVDLRTRGFNLDAMVAGAKAAGFTPHEIVIEKDHLHLEVERPL